MHTFLAVLKDLWDFVWGVPVAPVPPVPAQPRVETLTSPVPIQLPSTAVSAVPSTTVRFGESGYVCVPKADIFYRPVLTFDGVIETVPYGTQLSLLSFEGRFARVAYGEGSAFVLKDSLAQEREEVYPVLKTGEIYSANHPDTKRIRTLLEDVFFTKELYLPLQSVEFVLYILTQVGRTITWPNVRPRTAGTWQQILKGRTGIQIGILPKTGAVLEYARADGTGFVAYTKAVHVDESIVIEGVGRLIEGEYREEVLSKEEWQALQPVWISIS